MNLCNGSLCIFAFLILLLFLYFKQLFSYWESRGVYVSSKPKFIFGNAFPLLRRKYPARDIFKEIYDDCQSKLKKMTGFYFFGKPCLIITDLDLVKRIMKTDFEYFTDRFFHNHESDPLSEHLTSSKGHKWKKLRTMLSPVFTSAKTKMMFPTMAKYADQFVHILQSLNTGVIEVHRLTNRYSMDVIGTCAFGIDCNCLINPNSEFEHYARQFYSVSVIGSLTLMFTLFCPDVLKLFKLRSIKKNVGDFFLKMVSENIKVREEKNIVRADFMHLLIQVKNNIEINEKDVGDLDKAVKSKSALSVTNITAESVMFFMAGHEPPSATIAFCLYEFSINLDIQEKARQNVVEALAKHNGEFCYDTVLEMDYIEKCVKETLRKYPSAPVHLRECTKPYTIPDTNVNIEKGTPVFIPYQAFHMDQKIFRNPEKFDPERFSEENISIQHPCSWTPFGFGPRNCIGIRFALMETKTCLAKLLINFNFTASHLTKVPISISAVSAVTVPENGIWLNVTSIS